MCSFFLSVLSLFFVVFSVSFSLFLTHGFWCFGLPLAIDFSLCGVNGAKLHKASRLTMCFSVCPLKALSLSVPFSMTSHAFLLSFVLSECTETEAKVLLTDHLCLQNILDITTSYNQKPCVNKLTLIIMTIIKINIISVDTHLLD